MSLIDTIRADQLTARKSKDAVAVPLLTTLIGEATKVTEEEYKKGLTILSDEKVITTVKKFLKNAEETLRHLETSLIDEAESKIAVVKEEISILKSYLPQQLNEEQLSDIINKFKSETPGYNIGSIMSYLKTNFAGLYDGALASKLAKG